MNSNQTNQQQNEQQEGDKTIEAKVDNTIIMDSSQLTRTSDKRKDDFIQVIDNNISPSSTTDADPGRHRGQISNQTSRIVSPDLGGKAQQQPIPVGKFFSVSITGSLETGQFISVNDVYIKYTVLAGSDWLMSSGTDMGITQISRYRLDGENKRQFAWNQPISLSYRSYNFYGWPQIVLSVYHFDTFGTDQILGYGCCHLPVASSLTSDHPHIVKIYAPQSTSYLKQLLTWLTGRKPELVDSTLFARGDCRGVLQTTTVGEVKFFFNLTTKDVSTNGFKNG